MPTRGAVYTRLRHATLGGRRSAVATLALALAVLVPGPGQARAEPAPPWTVQIDPLTTALGYVHVQVERRLADRFSIYLGPSLRLYEGIVPDDEDESFRGYGGEIGLRYFVRGGAPAGFWLEARGVAAYLTADDDDAFGGYASALGGYTWIWRDRWVLAGGIGIQYLHYRVAGLGTEGVLPALHTAAGVAF